MESSDIKFESAIPCLPVYIPHRFEKEQSLIERLFLCSRHHPRPWATRNSCDLHFQPTSSPSHLCLKCPFFLPSLAWFPFNKGWCPLLTVLSVPPPLPHSLPPHNTCASFIICVSYVVPCGLLRESVSFSGAGSLQYPVQRTPSNCLRSIVSVELWKGDIARIIISLPCHLKFEIQTLSCQEY